MTQDAFDRLLSEMPNIAKAVNDFESEEVQRSAFAVLVRAMGVDVGSTADDQAGQKDRMGGRKVTESGTKEAAAPPAPNEPSNGKRSRKSPPKRGPSPVKDLDLRPSGKPSFKDFAAEKKPATFYERNLVALYYLEHVMGLTNIGAPHILAAYRECSWREPGVLAQSIRDTSARRGWLDSSDGSNLATTANGRNLVIHDMPLAEAAKK